MSAFPRIGPDSVWRVAARYGDADVEEAGIPETLRRQDIDSEEFLHIADQRALRVVLQMTRGIGPHELDHLSAFALTQAEQQLHGFLTAAYMDGLYIGWRARRLAEGGDE